MSRQPLKLLTLCYNRLMTLGKTSRWARFVSWTQRHARPTTVVTIGLIIISAGGVATAYFYPAPAGPVAKTSQQKAAEEAAKKWYSPLTGVEVPDEATTKRQVTAIMIENSTYARPQSGIKPAGVVFEAIAEGGITRLLTLHQEDRPQLIGPVRSIRPYYVDWLAPFDAAVAHVGGSYNALQTVRNGQFKDIDQFFNGKYYWRADDRPAPHNVYTSFDKLDALNTSKGFTSSSFASWPRKTDSPTPTPNATKIDITISSKDFNVHYDYDPASNSYVRSEGGAAHKDREAGQVSPKVVVAIHVPTQLGFEDGYREQMTTTGMGVAYIFQDGQVIEAMWGKASQKGQIRFYDTLGRPIALNAGQTWISVVAPDRKVTWQ